MIKHIKPVIRIEKIEGEVHRMIRKALSERHEILELQGGWLPLIDIYERGDVIVVEAEAPGLAAQDIVISLHMSRLEIKGVKKEGPIPESIRYLRLEREYGKFQRTVPLPCSVYPDKAKAYLENGILTIFLKKLREVKDKEVVVKIQKSQE